MRLERRVGGWAGLGIARIDCFRGEVNWGVVV